MSMKVFNGNNSPHELLLPTRQKTKLRNAFENNMSADIKLSNTEIAKIIQAGGLLGSLLRSIRSINESSCPTGKKYFGCIRNNSCCFSN